MDYPTLIVVEDDPDDFALLKRALWKAGSSCRVWWAHDAIEALQLLDDLGEAVLRICIVLDIQLPGLNGFDVLSQIRASKHGLRTKVVFLTGFSDAGTIKKAQTAGANAYFVKPAEPEKLCQIARELQKLAVGEENNKLANRSLMSSSSK